MESLQKQTEPNPSSVSQTQQLCPVCGSIMYPTNRSNFEITFRCSSPEARFWDFERGTVEQAKAKEHWDQSLREILLSRV